MQKNSNLKQWFALERTQNFVPPLHVNDLFGPTWRVAPHVVSITTPNHLHGDSRSLLHILRHEDHACLDLQ
jgi:hypothetical protein